MRFPQSSLRNGETPPRTSNLPFHSTVSVQKLRRFNILILVFRLASFSFSLASAVFMITNSHGSDSPNWHDFDAFRFVLAANAIVAFYSLAEMGASIWEILKGTTLLPEIVQVWFDFGHDQVGGGVLCCVGHFILIFFFSISFFNYFLGLPFPFFFAFCFPVCRWVRVMGTWVLGYLDWTHFFGLFFVANKK
uniref:CASP-like protein n=1 Tax=Nelumbo nucifera TaxID=4432 RepID=A0A822Y5N1_NELNU|nr:TPA_asm: hypothetical protein HUJ06_029235 [Nelumbo nucifera]